MLAGCVLPRIAAVTLLLAAFSGCGRDQSSPSLAPDKETPKAAAVPRMKDPAYRQDLKNVQENRKTIAARRNRVAAQMEELVANARRALPEGATDEQVLHELQDNPRKYPGWRELSLKMRELNARAEKDLAGARRLVMARIKKEHEGTRDLKRGGSK